MAERVAREEEIVELPANQYRHNLRVLQRLDPAACRSVAEAAAAQLASIGIKADPSKVTNELYDGAVDIDLGSMLTWMKKVNDPKKHKRAIKQLQTIYATAMSRVPSK